MELKYFGLDGWGNVPYQTVGNQIYGTKRIHDLIPEKLNPKAEKSISKLSKHKGIIVVFIKKTILFDAQGNIFLPLLWYWLILGKASASSNELLTLRIKDIIIL